VYVNEDEYVAPPPPGSPEACRAVASCEGGLHLGLYYEAIAFIKPLQYSRGCAPADCDQLDAGGRQLGRTELQRDK